MVQCPTRRHVLIAAGSSLAVAGCLGGQDEADNVVEFETNTTSDESTNNTADNLSTTATVDEVDLEPVAAGPITQIAIVDADSIDARETPAMYRIIIENTGEERREVTIQIKHDGEVVLEGTDELPPHTVLELTVDEGGTYTTTIESRSAHSSTTTTVSNNDCESRSIISFDKSGVISMHNENHC